MTFCSSSKVAVFSLLTIDVDLCLNMSEDLNQIYCRRSLDMNPKFIWDFSYDTICKVIRDEVYLELTFLKMTARFHSGFEISIRFLKHLMRFLSSVKGTFLIIRIPLLSLSGLYRSVTNNNEYNRNLQAKEK